MRRKAQFTPNRQFTRAAQLITKGSIMKKLLLFTLVIIVVALAGCTGVPEANDIINTDISDTEIITETGNVVTMPDEYGEYTPAEEFTYYNGADGITINGYTGSSDTVIFPPTIDGIKVAVIVSPFKDIKDQIKKIVFPPALKIINFASFMDNTSLEEVIFTGNELELIDEYAFKGCTSLKYVSDFPESLKRIGKEAFYGCFSLEHISVSSNCIEGESSTGAFAKSGLQSVELKSAVVSIAPSAFADCDIKRVVFSETVERIEAFAFAGNTHMTEIVLNNGLKEIDEQAFACTAVTEIVIPETVSVFYDDAFSGNPGFNAFKFEGDAPEKFEHSDFMDEYASGITVYAHEDTFEYRKIVAEYGYLYDRW